MRPNCPNTRTWRQLLSTTEPLVLPGAYDALSARLIEQAGFHAYVIGGFPLIGARYGLPDIGLVGLGEMSAGVRDIIAASDLPVLVDGDHGYGDVKNVTRTVRTYESMGVSALLLEDQVAQKRCGHVSGKAVVDPEVMETRVRAAAAARCSDDFFIIARTDARATVGLDETLRRAERYIAAGADGLFVEAPESIEELETIGRSFDVPQVANMLVGGRTPILSSSELYELGFQIVVHGTTLIKRVARALQQTLAELKADDADFDSGQLATLDDFMEITGASSWFDIERLEQDG